jgi:hypothetical protein
MPFRKQLDRQSSLPLVVGNTEATKVGNPPEAATNQFTHTGTWKKAKKLYSASCRTVTQKTHSFGQSEQ